MAQSNGTPIGSELIFSTPAPPGEKALNIIDRMSIANIVFGLLWKIIVVLLFLLTFLQLDQRIYEAPPKKYFLERNYY
jgi:hypothetical protein